ncbi:MAG TPA: hypothetical protein VHZ73_04740, partial [Vicinamibacterales bacterium]|nr:hypothetical protein [Vicinamibacterales bacterium]
MARPVTRLYAALATLTVCGVPVGCASEAPSPSIFPADSAAARAAAESGGVTPNREFAGQTRSPQVDAEPRTDAGESDLAATCGASDAALAHVAKRFAGRADGETGTPDAVDVDALGYELRAAGSPYVWPRAWRFDGLESQLVGAKARMQSWLSGFGDGGSRRCGVALVHRAGGRLTAFVIAVDALADLDAVPTRVRVGQWVDVSATLRVPADAAKLVVLGPRGAPYAVPTSLDHGRLQARFNADHEGAWLVQV